MSYIGGGANKLTERREKFAIEYALLIISHGGNIQKTIGIGVGQGKGRIVRETTLTPDFRIPRRKKYFQICL